MDREFDVVDSLVYKLVEIIFTESELTPMLKAFSGKIKAILHQDPCSDNLVVLQRYFGLPIGTLDSDTSFLELINSALEHSNEISMRDQVQEIPKAGIDDFLKKIFEKLVTSIVFDDKELEEVGDSALGHLSFRDLLRFGVFEFPIGKEFTLEEKADFLPVEHPEIQALIHMRDRLVEHLSLAMRNFLARGDVGFGHIFVDVYEQICRISDEIIKKLGDNPFQAEFIYTSKDIRIFGEISMEKCYSMIGEEIEKRRKLGESGSGEIVNIWDTILDFFCSDTENACMGILPTNFRYYFFEFFCLDIPMFISDLKEWCQRNALRRKQFIASMICMLQSFKESDYGNAYSEEHTGKVLWKRLFPTIGYPYRGLELISREDDFDFEKLESLYQKLKVEIKELEEAIKGEG